jgi:hypothetical protein
VVARLERDNSGESFRGLHLGESVNFGMRGSRSAVPPLSNDCTCVVDEDAPDLRVFTRSRTAKGKFSCSTHNVVVFGNHPDSF